MSESPAADAYTDLPNEPDTLWVDRDDRGERIARDAVEEGDTVVFEWSPYQWWSRETDVSGRVVVEVTTAPADDLHVGDAVLEVVGLDGMTLRDYGGMGYVAGPAEFNDDTPDRTDVGRGGRYYELETDKHPTDAELAELRREAVADAEPPSKRFGDDASQSLARSRAPLSVSGRREAGGVDQ